MKIVDSHVYCLPPRLRNWRVQLPSSEKAILKAIYMHPEGPYALRLSAPEAILKSMKASEIDCSVLVSFPWRSRKLCAENNDYLLEECAKHKGLFMAICSVQPGCSGFLEEARRCIGNGAIGIKINPAWQGGRLDDAAVGHLARYVSEKGCFILAHTDQPFRKSSASPAHLFALLKRNPGIRIVAAHMGGLLGLYSSFLLTEECFKNVWFDTAISETLEIVSYYVQAGLADKIIFGTDYPFNLCHSQKDVKERLINLGLSKTVRNKIFGGNLRCMIQNGL